MTASDMTGNEAAGGGGADRAADEAKRLEAVRRYEILDTPPEGAFDRITAIAARRFGVPIAIVSIVDTDRIWFKSHHGLDVAAVGRDPGLCASAILRTDPLVLPDARLDALARANPLVAGAFGLRFYAGAPLTTTDGHNLGTLCVIDCTPHRVDDGLIADLTDLASVVMDQMELRLSARRAVAEARLMAREIDHRVMNSLQLVASLLSMQSRAPGAGAAAAPLEMAAGRVAAIARIHRHFYSAGAGTASCIGFLRRLCTDLSGILGRAVEVEGDEGEVATAAMQAIGLVVNELVTNAAKHAGGRIAVSLRLKGGQYALSVTDEGKGLPPGFDPAAGTGLGMKVVTALARQLAGRLSCRDNPAGKGACFTLVFTPPALEAD